uniref:F-box 1 n=1 Tax=Prunus armeniaca TaxID=36596 RepID=Q0QDH3_PRUAR|nr:F-box 1 [Prunus armeniaca]
MASTTLRKKEILTDILVRLPAKTLVRFLCACKSWSDLINSSSFITTQLNRNVTKHLHVSLLCLHYPDLKRPFEFYENYEDYPDLKRELEWSLFSNETFEHCSKLNHPLGIKKDYRVYGSSNGLVCISDDKLDTKSPIHIWNPSVRKFRTLPMSTNVKFRYIALQFGFHPGVNDYKVVRMLRVHKDDAFAVEVYSLSTDSWKKG